MCCIQFQSILHCSEQIVMTPRDIEREQLAAGSVATQHRHVVGLACSNVNGWGGGGGLTTCVVADTDTIYEVPREINIWICTWVRSNVQSASQCECCLVSAFSTAAFCFLFSRRENECSKMEINV
jgi:hypothetical protein